MINTGAKLILVDTGSGPGALKQTSGELGQLPQNLAAAGIKVTDIDAVVISHFHGDHVNGLLDESNKLAFPNAEVLVPATEWKFWMDDGEMSRASPGRMADLFKSNRKVFDAIGRKVTPYAWDKELAPGLMPIPTVGHSIGHTSYVLASGSDKLYVQSDVTNNPDLFARHPDWSANFDQDGPQAIATRRKVYDMLVAEKMLVQGFHYPFPGLARVEKAEAGYRVVPASWSPTPVRSPPGTGCSGGTTHRSTSSSTSTGRSWRSCARRRRSRTTPTCGRFSAPSCSPGTTWTSPRVYCPAARRPGWPSPPWFVRVRTCCCSTSPPTTSIR